MCNDISVIGKRIYQVYNVHNRMHPFSCTIHEKASHPCTGVKFPDIVRPWKRRSSKACQKILGGETMKKLFAILLALTMVLAMFAGCSNNQAAAPTNAPAAENNNESATVEKPKVALLLTTLGDAGINDASYAGFERACAELPIDGQYIEQGRDSAKYRALLMDTCENYDLVITTAGMGMVDEVIAIAPEYPEVKFLVLDCPITQEGIADLPNFAGAMCKQSELSFLAGALAAGMTESGRIGMAFGFEYPTLSDFIIGYIAGAQYVNPDIEIALSAVGSFTDQAAGKETALAQAQINCDVIYAVAAGASFGILEGCKEAGVMGIGCDTDMAAQFIGTDDAQADVIISSAFKDWGQLIYDWVDAMVNGGEVQWGTVRQYDVASNGCYLIKNDIYNETVPEDVKEMMLDIEAKIASGEIDVPSYFEVEESVYQDMVASVSLTQ